MRTTIHFPQRSDRSALTTNAAVSIHDETSDQNDIFHSG